MSGGTSLHKRSHGEAFLALAEARFDRAGIYLLDEPEAALSPQRQLAFLVLLARALRAPDTQFIIATHSPILLAFPGADILSFDGNTIRRTTYRETEAFKITSSVNGQPKGSPALSMTARSGGVQQARAKQVDVGASEHLPLEHLDLVHLALGLSVAPRECDRCAYCGQITTKTRCELAELGRHARVGGDEPTIEGVDVAITLDKRERVRQPSRVRDGLGADHQPRRERAL